jgi:cholesterol transport system auxiliary component
VSRFGPSARAPFASMALAVAASLTLAGCISVFPKAKPSQLYRFGLAGAPAAAQASPAASPVVGRGRVAFQDAAATDRILTVTGNEAAYVAGARWVSPAPVLFEESLTRAFQAPGGPRFSGVSGGARAPIMLDLDVQSFETRYDQGRSAPPEVVVQIHAILVRTEDHVVIADQLFSAAKRAGDNRMGPIVQAYDEAVQDVLSNLTAWTARAA